MQMQQQRTTIVSRLGACALVVAGLLGPAPVLQAWAQGGTAGVTRGEHNVYAAGGQVRPAAPVEGDYVAAGGRVILDQPVRGDAALAGGSVDVRAPVGDDLRAVGGDINIESTVGGELFVTGGNLTLARAARVTRSATLYGGSITLDGRIDGPLQASAGKITVNGQVGGDATLAAEQIELGPEARIAGALRYTSASELKQAPGATVVGTITHEQRAAGQAPAPAQQRWHGGSRSVGGSVLGYLALLACAAVFMLVAPGFSADAADTMKASPGMALALGFGALVAVPVLAVLLFVTVLGIPLGLTVLALYPVLLLVGYLVGVLCIARLAQVALRKDAPPTFGWRIGFFALALLMVTVAGRVPVVGWLLLCAVTVMGTGACLLDLYRRRQGGAPPAPAQAPQGTPATAG
jgi:cytoskeletal protein CcmA (bactofilin family)